jgi:serine/threonine protein kinase/tetratricopeptide (TPR) repeat protein
MNDAHPTGPGGLTPDELTDVEAIFSEVADVEVGLRPVVLETRCAGRPQIRREVEALLESHDRMGAFLDAPDETVPGQSSERSPAFSTGLEIGALVGPYRLIEQIGEGGMGDVFLAERADGLFTHRVAIKVTRASLRDASAARRFSAERQILASLQHAHIVTLLDGGVSPSADAYLVMEYVDGVPLTTFCRTLGLEERLRLIRQVCGAVQYAHQRGIVHRDLKPGNILVTSDGVAKVLDFGVAKLLEPSVGTEPTLTRAFPGPLTPNYASPEQLRGLPVTTATDVYALGVVTYEIVTGKKPYDTAGKTMDQVLSLVLDTEPTRPSAIASTTDPYLPRREKLKGDLDAIVLKAMSKEPERRYGSAGELGDDIDRFLSGRPVVAQEPSIGYLLRRLAGRNKVAVTVAAASLFAILGALGVALWQQRVARHAQLRAEQRFTEVRQLANTLIFKIHDAVRPLPGSTPVRQTIVTEALAYLERLERESHNDEALQLELSRAYRQIGQILGSPAYANLGDREGALRQFERARALILPLASRPNASPQAISALVNTNTLFIPIVRLRDKARAVVLATETVDYAQRVSTNTAADVGGPALLAKASFELAMCHHPSKESIPYWQRTMDGFEAQFARQPTDDFFRRGVALTAKYFGSVFAGLGQIAEAERYHRRALELDERAYLREPDNRVAQFDYAIDLANVAGALEFQGRLAEAADMLGKSLEIRKSLSNSDPKDVLAKGRFGHALIRVARLRSKLGRHADALPLAREAVVVAAAVAAQTSDADSRRNLATTLFRLGGIEQAMGQKDVACATYMRARRTFEPNVPRQGEPDFYEWQATQSATAECDARKTG